MVPHIILPGKIALFGGHREGDETFLETVVREVHEETSYFVPPEPFKFLGSFTGADDEVEGGTTDRHYFLARDIPVDVLVITEGSLVIAKSEDLALLADEFTPVAKAALAIFFNLA
jgi:8-oxo-dGTP pyrophosphatase MutT (NUDIX family)